jgi:oligopeptide/dipeptide ABC transporter ATP-binding protein
MSIRPLIEIRNLTKQYTLPNPAFFGRPYKVLALDRVSFDIEAGQTFGLVGESGSGKSTVARTLLKLERPTSGQVLAEGKDVFAQTSAEQMKYRRFVQSVFQDPYGTLSPRLKISSIVSEPLRAQGVPRAQALERAEALLELVGLRVEFGNSYPYQLSGGQRQRVAIARALSVDPRFLILDEPVSALDVSVRAQILNLLLDIQARLNTAFLFIGHDLAVVKLMSRNVGVMYFGRLVEVGPADLLLARPLHPYTRRLVVIAAGSSTLGSERLFGDMPNPLDPPSGSGFRTRCPHATDRCRVEFPELRAAGEATHQVACHHFEALDRGNTTGRSDRRAINDASKPLTYSA